jgi:hypothetical protein
MPMRRSTEARKLLESLNSELADASIGVAPAGQKLAWSAEETQLLTMIGDTVDRKGYLARQFDDAETVTQRIAISVEIRLLESAAAKLLTQLRASVKQSLQAASPHTGGNQRSRRASKAAHARWDEHARLNGA